jgi:hypothetical protein
MLKKIIFAILFAVLSTLANAQSIPPQIQGICINIKWVGTSLEASCLKNLQGYGGSEGGYQFSSLPYANECYPAFLAVISGFLTCNSPGDVPPSPPGGGVCNMPQYAVPPNLWQQLCYEE